MASNIYQTLMTCYALIRKNGYVPNDIPKDTNITVPVRCASPSENQKSNGVTYLLTHVIDDGDNPTCIGKMFGVNRETMLEANMLSQDSVLSPSTPILVPLRNIGSYSLNRENCTDTIPEIVKPPPKEPMEA